MEFVDQISEYSIQISTIGVVVAIYLMVFLNCNDSTTTEIETNRIINTLKSFMEGELNSLKVETKFENPYDLFAHIYPSLKDMDNSRIDELITVIDNYNKNWITEDD